MSRLTRLVKLKKLVKKPEMREVEEPECEKIVIPVRVCIIDTRAKKIARERFSEVFGRSFILVGFNPSGIPESALVRCWWNCARRCGGNVELTMAMLKDLAKIDDGCDSMYKYMEAQGRWRRYKLWLRGTIICAGPKYQEFNDAD